MFFLIKVPPEETVRRNSGRLICSVCGLQLMANDCVDQEKCLFCGGELRRRADDKPEVIKERIVEYEARTAPIFKEIERKGYSYIEIDGTPLPAAVYRTIVSHIEPKT
jgi:adenylate kinase